MKIVKTPFQVNMPFEKSDVILETFDYDCFDLEMRYLNVFIGINHQLAFNKKWKLRSECSFGLSYLVTGFYGLNNMSYYNKKRETSIHIATIDREAQIWNPDAECTFMLQRMWRSFNFGLSAGIQSLLFSPTLDRITYTLQPNTALEVMPSRLSFPLQIAVGHNFCNLPKSRYADGWYD
jgi:hypothetical protein